MTTMPATMGRGALLECLQRVPRAPFASLPTPLEEMPRLRAALGPETPRLLVKRDDLTGLAFGGNKVRHLEYRLADIQAKNADTLIISNRPQSNHLRVHAALAARYGLTLAILLIPNATHEQPTGNLLLDHILGARIVVASSPDPETIERERAALIALLKEEGRRVYDVSRDPFSRLAASISYLQAAVELLDQLASLDVRLDHIFMAAGKSSAGLALAGKVLGASYRVHPVGSSTGRAAIAAQTCGLANEVATYLGMVARLEPTDISVHEGAVDTDPTMPAPASLAALQVVARTEGLLLDPIYTARAMATLIDQIRRGAISRDETVVFLHSGGLPALFAYSAAILAQMDGS